MSAVSRLLIDIAVAESIAAAVCWASGPPSCAHGYDVELLAHVWFVGCGDLQRRGGPCCWKSGFTRRLVVGDELFACGPVHVPEGRGGRHSRPAGSLRPRIPRLHRQPCRRRGRVRRGLRGHGGPA